MFDLDDVTRYIVAFTKIPDRDGECYAVAHYQFARPVSLSFLQDLFGVNPNDPDEGERYMIDCFHIHEKEAEALQPFVDEKLDLNKYLFSLYCSDKESYKNYLENLGKEEWKPTHSELHRFIDAYPNDPDENGELNDLRFELQKPISIEFLNELFHVDPKSDEVFFGDELNEEQARALQPYFKEKLDTERYLLILTAKRKPVDEKK